MTPDVHTAPWWDTVTKIKGDIIAEIIVPVVYSQFRWPVIVVRQ